LIKAGARTWIMTYSASVELPKVHMATAAPIHGEGVKRARRCSARECGGCSQKLAPTSPWRNPLAKCKLMVISARGETSQIETNAKEI
jgi:hypothetical protein